MPPRRDGTTPRVSGRRKNAPFRIRWSRSATAPTGDPGAGLGTEPTSNIGVMVSQDVAYPGKLDLKASIASREADAEFQQIDAARLSITARVKQAYSE